MARLEFFYDYGSPFSYLIDTQLASLCERAGAELVYRPMLLGGVFKATGNRSPMQEPVESKRTYTGLMLQRWVDHYAYGLFRRLPGPVLGLLMGLLAWTVFA